MALSTASNTTVRVVVVGTIVSYLSAPILIRAFRCIFDYIYGSNEKTVSDVDAIQVVIKTSERNVPVNLSPKWSIAEVKHHLSKFVGREAVELRIIVAGHELRDDVKVADCDLGESTVIHAVKVFHRPAPLPSVEIVSAQQNDFIKNLDETKTSEVPNEVDTCSNHNSENENLHSNPHRQQEGDKPMNECLLDLQLTEEERNVIESNRIQDISSPNHEHFGRINTDTDSRTQDVFLSNKEKARAHFWVYCSDMQCGSRIQPGKLRVRCDFCKEGAILVKSDPCNWDDVLNSKRIHGYCQNDKCKDLDALEGETSTVARLRPVEFYFKCYGPNHNRNKGNIDNAGVLKLQKDSENQISNIETPPLYLIRSNLRNIPCLACTDDEVNPVLVFGCPDHHVICIPCFQLYCISRLNDRSFTLHKEFGYTLGCPVGCENSWVPASSKHFAAVLMNDLVDKQTKSEYEKYQRFAAEEFVLQSGGALCPQPNCGAGIMPKEEVNLAFSEENISPERKIVCPECRYVFCRNCQHGYHLGECDESDAYPVTRYKVDGKSNANASTILANQNLISRARWISEDEIGISEQNDNVGATSSWVAIRVTTKPCPKCRTPTERSGGCMHMECTKAGCGFQWCWVCQTEWTRDCMGNHWFG